MAEPVVTVQVAWATNPAATPTWVTLTGAVQEFSIRRGRAHELDNVQAGTATIRLDNAARAYEPETTASANYPNVIPLRRVRIQATYNATTYTLFTGYIETWDVAYPQERDSDVTISAFDAIAVLAMTRVSGTFAQQNAAVRTAAILDAIGWPAADRDIAAPQQSTQAVTLADVSALSHLQQVWNDENALLYVSAGGVLTTRNRHSRVKLPITNYLTYGDGGGAEQPHMGLTFSLAADRVVNDARVTATGGVQQVSADTASQAKYYIRTRTAGGYQIRDADAYRVATFLTGRYAAPYGMLTLRLGPHYGGDPQWTNLLARELNDRITVRKANVPGGGAAIDRVCHIEAIQMDWDARGGMWDPVTYLLTPADTTAYWQVEDATYGLLGSTTRVGY